MYEDTVIPSYSEEALLARGKERAEALPVRLGVEAASIKGAKILEIGCGYGETSFAVQQQFGASVSALDPWPRIDEGPFKDKFEVLKVPIDEVEENQNGQFDVIHSYDVFEHIADPIGALEKVYSLLKVGGRAFLKFNLFRGAQASHVDHLIFPWCHLLMSWDAMKPIAKIKSGGARSPDPVNKLSRVEYLFHMRRIGFLHNKPPWYARFNMTDELYDAFEDDLKWYPKEDLALNFMMVSLLKPSEDDREEFDLVRLAPQ